MSANINELAGGLAQSLAPIRRDLTAFSVPVDLRELTLTEGTEDGKRGFGAEQIVSKLRQIEVLMVQGKTAALASKEVGVSEQSYYRWRKEYGGLEIDQAKRMKELERENQRLKRLVADLSVEKQVLKDIASGNF